MKSLLHHGASAGQSTVTPVDATTTHAVFTSPGALTKEDVLTFFAGPSFSAGILRPTLRQFGEIAEDQLSYSPYFNPQPGTLRPVLREFDGSSDTEANNSFFNPSRGTLAEVLQQFEEVEDEVSYFAFYNPAQGSLYEPS